MASSRKEGVQTPCRAAHSQVILGQATNGLEERAVSLFKRQKSMGTPCPRCSQLVTDDNADACPMCGWDVREAYQGPATASNGPTTPTVDRS